MMTTEMVLLLAVYAFVLLGVFLGPGGPVNTYKTAAPNLAGHIERNISTGRGFTDKQGAHPIDWIK